MLVIMAMACALGAIMGPLAGLFPALLPSAFSSDPALWPLMRSVAWQVGIPVTQLTQWQCCLHRAGLSSLQALPTRAGCAAHAVFQACCMRCWRREQRRSLF